MARLITLECHKSYKTRGNAVKAVDKIITNPQLANLRYFIYTTEEGRFFPVFIGQEALSYGMHFHFNVVA